VLADLSRTLQVLLFTHNDHLVELARPNDLHVHELNPRPRAGAESRPMV